jgi:two-component system, sensor histidine kinase and response regulator
MSEAGTDAYIGHARRILIVDDNPADLAFYRRCLAHDGCRVHEAVNGDQAFEVLNKEPIDCVLLDYRLPRNDGLEVLRLLKGDLNLRTIPVIMLTGEGNESVAVEALHSGAVDYIRKESASLDVFQKAIRNAVEKHRLRQLVTLRKRRLELANDQLRKQNEEIQRFYHVVSHEIKTPLTAAREFISIVMDGLAGDVTSYQTECLNYAIASCDQIASQFNELIDTARLDAGKLVLKFEPVDVTAVFERAMASAGAPARDKGIVIETEIEPGAVSLVADERRVVQVVSNLLGNAVKFTPPRGHVWLKAAVDPESNDLVLSVRDSGCGIAKEHLDKVFDRLYQIEPDPTQARPDDEAERGLGLGLSIAKELVRLHGGELGVLSGIGGGSTFVVRLPREPREL